MSTHRLLHKEEKNNVRHLACYQKRQENDALIEYKFNVQFELPFLFVWCLEKDPANFIKNRKKDTFTSLPIISQYSAYQVHTPQ